MTGTTRRKAPRDKTTRCNIQRIIIQRQSALCHVRLAHTLCQGHLRGPKAADLQALAPSSSQDPGGSGTSLSSSIMVHRGSRCPVWGVRLISLPTTFVPRAQSKRAWLGLCCSSSMPLNCELSFRRSSVQRNLAVHLRTGNLQQLLPNFRPLCRLMLGRPLSHSVETIGLAPKGCRMEPHLSDPLSDTRTPICPQLVRHSGSAREATAPR